MSFPAFDENPLFPPGEAAGETVTAPPAPAPVPPRRLRPWEWRLVGWLLVVFLLRDVPWRLDEFDQAKQAYTSLEMVQTGHWWFQHLPGRQAVATKPPLVGWTSAAIYYLTGGHWEIAWRLPSLLAALALAVLLWRAGEQEWPGWGGILAAAGFGFNFLAPRLATLVRTDMPLTLWVTLLGLLVWRHVRNGGRPWDHRSRWAVFATLLLALMTKGPIAYAFLLPGMVVHSWLCRRRGHTAAHTWGGWWHWTLPLLPFLFWLERGIITMPGFYDQVLGREFVGRFTVGEAAVHHNQPVWFYFAQLLTRWAPWSVLLLAVRFRARRLWWAMCREPGTLWLVCWAAGGLLFMSLVPSKRVDRIFPAVPPLCLVLTALLARAQRQAEADGGDGTAPARSLVVATARDRWPLRWSRWTVGGALLLTVGTTVGGVGQAYYRHDDAPAAFAARVRAATIARDRRVEVVVEHSPVESDGTMLVYLRRLSFLSPAEVLTQLSFGKLDAVVLTAKVIESTGGPTGLLEPFAPARPELASPQAKPPYFLLSPRMKPVVPIPTPPPASRRNRNR